MDEQQIADNLKQNLPQPYKTDIAPSDTSEAITGQADASPPLELDELTMYKVHDFFGQQYKDTNESAKQQAKFVYEEVAKQIGTTDYPAVISKIIDLEGLIGTRNSDNRMYRLYEWLRLDTIRRSTENQMQSIRYAS